MYLKHLLDRFIQKTQNSIRALSITWTKLVVVLCVLPWIGTLSYGINDSDYNGANYGISYPVSHWFNEPATAPVTPSVDSITPYPSGSWLEHQTQRVQILFQPQDQQAAMEIASYADEIVEQLSLILEYSPPELIPVILRGQTDQANGYFTVGPKRVVLMVSPDSRYPGYFGPAETWLRLVFTHELVHYIQLTRPIGIPGTMGRWLGELPGGGAAAGTLPGWFIEGTAVYLETLLTSGGRGRSGAFTMEILANLYDLDSWTYKQAGYDALASFDSRIYRSGYILVSYIAQEFGFGLLNRLQEATWSGARIDGARGFDQHLERLTGISNDELWARSQRAFLQRHWDQLSQLPGSPWSGLPTNPGIFARLSLPERVDGGWIISYQDVWTPGSLAFISDQTPLPQTGSHGSFPQIQLLTPVWLQNSQSFAALGSWVVFSQREFRTTEADSGSTTTGLYLGRLDLSNSNGARLTNIVPLGVNSQDNLLLDLHSPAIFLESGIQPEVEQKAQQESLQKLHVLALERIGSSHRLIALVDHLTGLSTDQSNSESVLGPGLWVTEERVLSQELERRVLYQGDTRLGSPRINPSGTLVALPEHRGSSSRLLLLNPMTGEVLEQSTPWVYGSVEHPRWFSDDQLVITLDSQGFRKPYLIDLTQPGSWLQLPSDPVGTGAAMIGEHNQLIYQTVRSRSHQILTHNLPPNLKQLGQFQPMSRSLVQEIDKDVPMDLWVQTPARNLLRFHTWFPNLLIRPSAFGTDEFFLDIDLAPGAVFLFNDPVEEQSLAIQGALYVRSLQPDFLLAYNRVLSRGIFGPQNLGIIFQQTYRSSFSSRGVPEGFQTTSLSFRSQSTLGQWNGLGHTTRLLGAITLQGSWTIEGRREFSIAHGFRSVQILNQNFPGTQDTETLVARPGLSFSGGLGLVRWSLSPRWAFYGGNQFSFSSSVLVSPDLTGYAQGAPTLAGLANFNLGRLVFGGSLLRFRASTAVSNGLIGSSLLELPGGFLPIYRNPTDGALGTSAHLSIPLAITDIKSGRLVLDRVGFSLGAHWQAGLMIPGVRNAALEDSLLARSAWFGDTGSTLGAPGTSAQAFAQVSAVSLPSIYSSNRFLPSRFIAFTATLDLGIGVWAPQRPLLQLGASVKVPLSTTESWGLLPLILFDIANLLP
jgi:hypothetical protein